jgi:hypothetical protein
MPNAAERVTQPAIQGAVEREFGAHGEINRRNEARLFYGPLIRRRIGGFLALR